MFCIGRVTTLNCKGLGDTKKRSKLRSTLRGTDVVCLQETTITTSSGSSLVKRAGFSEAALSHGDSRSRGAAVMVRGHPIVDSRTSDSAG